MNEDLIRSITAKVLQEMNGQADNTIPIGISARHVHLCKDDMEALFGVGHELTHFKDLMGGQYAAAETVTIVGCGATVLKARVLGPLRSATQVEVSATDSRNLGIKAPLRDSGDIVGTASLTLIGPKGSVFIAEGGITARRHIHMSPSDAVRLGVKDKDIVKIEIDSPRGGIFGDVLVRVDSSFTLEMHIDTDEANAFGITGKTFARIWR